jgi:hypothetical protein
MVFLTRINLHDLRDRSSFVVYCFPLFAFCQWESVYFILLQSGQIGQLVLLNTRVSNKGGSYRNILNRRWVIILRPNQKLPNHSVTQKCGLVFTLVLWVSGWSHKFAGFIQGPAEIPDDLITQLWVEPLALGICPWVSFQRDSKHFICHGVLVRRASRFRCGDDFQKQRFCCCDSVDISSALQY